MTQRTPSGGFDCILGNPPWEMLEAEDGMIATGRAAREQHWASIGLFGVLSGRRDLYKLFMVKARESLQARGRFALLVPLGVFLESDSGKLRELLFDAGSVHFLAHFQNSRRAFFEGVHASYRFCAVIASRVRDDVHRYSAVTRDPAAVQSVSWIEVPRADFDRLFGRSRLAVVCDSEEYARIHGRAIAAIASENTAVLRVVAEFHSSSDRGLIHKASMPGRYVVPKNRNIHHYNPQFSPAEQWVDRDEVFARLREKGLEQDAWKSEALRLLFRDIARSDDERTLIGCAAPPGYVSSYDTPMAVASDAQDGDPLVVLSHAGFMSSFLADFLIRPFVDKHVKGYVLARVPWPSVSTFESRLGKSWIAARVLELTAVSPSYLPIMKRLGIGDGLFCSDDARRFEVRCEIEAGVFIALLALERGGNRRADSTVVSGMRADRDAVAYIMDTFPIVRRKDEEAHGSYRTKERILALYDELGRCLAAGTPFTSSLNPPPGPPTNPDGTFAALPVWPKGAPQPATWPPHIHPPASHRI